MERQIKAPYIPPPDKLISDEEFNKLETIGNSVINELKSENL